jgi:hypothetical protein
VIFMASHGLNDKEKFYILPYDGDPERIRITGVDWSNFADVLGIFHQKYWSSSTLAIAESWEQTSTQNAATQI